MRKLICAAGCMIAVAISPAHAETTVLFNLFAPPSSPTVTKVMGPWLKDIERVTEGRVKIKVPPQSMAPPPEQMNMVVTGVADGAYQLNAFQQKSHPLLQISFLPGIMASGRANGVALWRTYQKFFAPKRPFKKVHLLGFFATPPGYLYSTSATPVQSIAQLKGKKVWSTPGMTARAIGLTGAAVVPGPAVRMYEIISKGVVDEFCCVEYGDLKAFKVLQFAKSITVVKGGVLAPAFSVFISNAKWAQISPRDQAAIMKISGEALARRAAGIDQHSKEVVDEYVAQGGIVEKAKPAFNAELEKVWKPLYDQWIASANKQGVDGKAALAYFKGQIKEVQAEQH